MAIAFRAASAMGSGTTSLAITTPASALAGDILIAFIGDKASSGTTTPPSGWAISTTAASSSRRIQIFTAKVGTGGVTANQSTTFSGLTTACIGACAAYSGVDNNTFLDATPTARVNVSGTTGAATLTTTTVSAYIVLGFISIATASTWSSEACATNPTSGNVTERLDSASATPMSIAIADGVRNPSTAGATGASSSTMGTAGTNGGAIVALRAAVAPTLALAATDAIDTLTAQAQDVASLALSATDTPDTLTAAIGANLGLSFGLTDTPDTLAFQLLLNPPLTTTLSATDAIDTLAAAITVQWPLLTTSLAATDARDTLTAAATVVWSEVVASLVATDALDTLAFSVALSGSGGKGGGSTHNVPNMGTEQYPGGAAIKTGDP